MVIPVIVIVLWGRMLLHLPVSDEQLNMPLWKFLHDILESFPSAVNYLIVVGLISFQAIYFNHLVNRHEVLYVNSYLPAFFYVLILSCTPHVLLIHPVHFVNLILLRALDKMFTLFKSDSPVSGIFDSSFLMALAALVYLPAMLYFLLLIIGVSLLRPFSWREIMIMFIGYSLPFFFLLVYLFWSGNLGKFPEMFSGTLHSPELILKIVPTPALISFASFCAMLLLLSLGKLRSNFYKNVIRTRTYQRIMLIFLVISGGTLLFTKGIQPVYLELLAIPLSVFFAYYFVSARKRLRLFEFMLWIFAGLILWNQFV